MIYRTLPEAVITEGEVKYLLTDHLGSVLRVMRADGSTESIHSYDEFGISEGKEPVYAGYGGYIPAGRDVYATESRYYAPKLGRFLSKDTWKGNIGNPQTWNRWIYVLNNPLRYKDASGYTPAEAMGNTYRQGVSESLGAYGAYSMLKADAGCGSTQTEVRSGYQAFQNQLRGESYHQLLNLIETGTAGLNAYQGMNLTTPSLADNLMTEGMLSGGMSYSSICKLLGINSGTDNISYLDGIEATNDDMLIQGTYRNGNVGDIISGIILRLGAGSRGVLFHQGEDNQFKESESVSEEREKRRERAEYLATKQTPLTSEEKEEAKQLIDKFRMEYPPESHLNEDEVVEQQYIDMLADRTSLGAAFFYGLLNSLSFGITDWMSEKEGKPVQITMTEKIEVMSKEYPKSYNAGHISGEGLKIFTFAKLLSKVPGVKGLKQKIGGIGSNIAASAGLEKAGQVLTGRIVSDTFEGVLIDSITCSLPNAVNSTMEGKPWEEVLEGIVVDTSESICSNVAGETLLAGIEMPTGIAGKNQGSVLGMFEISEDTAKGAGQVLEETTEGVAKNGTDVIDDVIEGGTDVIQSKFNKLLNSDYYKTDFGYDCSEIAQDFYDAAGQQGKIYRIEGKSGYINGYEYNNQVEYIYHEVYSDGTYIYDPRYTNVPVLKDDYFRALREINPDGFDVFEIME